MEQTMQLSASVRRVVERLDDQGEIPSWAVVRELLRAHPEYAQGQGGKIVEASGPEPGVSRPVGEWVEAAYQLYDPTKVDHLHGRLAIWGLTQLDPALREYLAENGFLAILEDEITRDSGPPGALLQQTADATPAADEAFGQTLAIAAILARHAGKTVDSVLLLVALLYQETSDEKATAGNAVLQALMPDALSDPAPTPADQIAIALDLRATYGLTVSGQDLARESSLASRSTPPIEPECAQAVTAAGQLAARTTPTGPLAARHLLGALLASSPKDTRPQVQGYLRSLGRDLAGARGALLDYIRREHPGDVIAEWERLLLTPDFLPPTAGYISDSVDPAAPDRLDITHEVSTIAHVLTYKQVKPPLSLGLFGDWGSGKSFFIAKLKESIKQIEANYRRDEEKTGTPSQWCTRVLHIDFNAWHFSDANLWASLVTRIYEALYGELDGEKETDRQLRSKLETRIEGAEGMVQEATAQVTQAAARASAAASALSDAREKRQEQEETLHGLIGNVGTLLAGNPEVRVQVDRAAKAIGYSEAAQSYEALQALGDDLKTASGRASAVVANVVRAPRTLLILAILVIGLPLAIGFGLERIEAWIGPLEGWIGPLGRQVAEISIFLTGLIAWLRTQVNRGLDLVATIENGLQEAQRIRQDAVARDPTVKQAEQNLVRAQAEEQAARDNLRQSEAEVQRLQSELQELRPERKLSRLLEDRSRSAAYSQHLGIISLIRTDFEAISDLLVDLAAERRDLKLERPPIQRIILYIDDLDRCRPSRVVEVLEAVHMLLAFPLFTVVVGVDPRWLRRSLAVHYADTLADDAQPARQNGQGPRVSLSTPQDYLEKIFQIPFTLRPVEEGGYRHLIADLLQPLPDSPSRDAGNSATPDARPQGNGQSTPSDTPDRASQPDDVRDDNEGAATAGVGDGAAEANSPPGGQASNGSGEAQSTSQAEEVPFVPLNPAQLAFTKREMDEIAMLWPLFRTPRTVKRYINIYRLLRAGLTSEEEVEAFEGIRSEPGEYQLAMIMLAVVTAFPNESARFLQRLEVWWEADQESNVTYHWTDVITELREPAPTSGNIGEVGANGQLSAQNGEGDDGSDWEVLIESLDQVVQTGFGRSFGKAALKRWAVRVARFSFSVRPAEGIVG